MFINQNLWSCLCSNQFLSNSVMEESSQCHCVSLVDGEQYFFFIFFSVQKLIWREVTLKEPKDLKLFRISRMLSWCFFLHSDSLMCRQIKKEFTFFDVQANWSIQYKVYIDCNLRLSNQYRLIWPLLIWWEDRHS